MLLYAFYIIEGNIRTLAPLFTTELPLDVQCDTSATQVEPGKRGAKPKGVKEKSKKNDTNASGTSDLANLEMKVLQEAHDMSKQDVLLARIKTTSSGIQEAKDADDDAMVEFWTEQRKDAMVELKALQAQKRQATA